MPIAAPAGDETRTQVEGRVHCVVTTMLWPGASVAVIRWPLLSLIVAGPATEETSVTAITHHYDDGESKPPLRR